MSGTGAGQRMFPLRTVVFGTFLPSILFEMGVGAFYPVIPSLTTSMGHTLGIAGLIATLVPIGQVLADLPGGEISQRFGDRAAMAIGAVISALAFTGAALAPNIWSLGAAALGIGAASAIFNLARHSYLTAITPPLQRARVLSTLGGVHRIGFFCGPFVGAAVIHHFSEGAVLWIGTVAALIVLAVLWAVGPDEQVAAPARAARAARAERKARAHAGADEVDAPDVAPTIGEMLRRYWRIFATLGIGVLAIGAVRGARQSVLPMWAEFIGLDGTQTSLIFGISAAIDMLLFYPAGKVMDSYGRIWVAVPSMIIMGTAMIAIPFSSTIQAMAVVSLLIGIGNGMSSGILMTLGSDVAPERGRSQFLGAWRLLQDSGAIIGPGIVSAAAALSLLAGGIMVSGALGLVAAAAMARWIPAWTPHASRRTRREAGLPDGSGKPRRRKRGSGVVEKIMR